jgi:hypothetical protein
MEKKRSHRAVEKRRRDKINTSIKELETLVPGCKDLSETNKAAVLLKTAEFVANLMQANIELQNQTRRLEDSNAQLASELAEMQAHFGNLPGYQGHRGALEQQQHGASGSHPASAAAAAAALVSHSGGASAGAGPLLETTQHSSLHNMQLMMPVHTSASAAPSAAVLASQFGMYFPSAAGGASTTTGSLGGFHTKPL